MKCLILTSMSSVFTALLGLRWSGGCTPGEDRGRRSETPSTAQCSPCSAHLVLQERGLVFGRYLLHWRFSLNVSWCFTITLLLSVVLELLPLLLVVLPLSLVCGQTHPLLRWRQIESQCFSGSRKTPIFNTSLPQ